MSNEDSVDSLVTRLMNWGVRLFNTYLGYLFETGYDLGIENVRLRGIARILIGVVLTAIGLFVGYVLGAIGVWWGGGDVFVLVFVGLAIPIFTQVYIIWGVVEFVSNVAWANLNGKIRLILLLFLGTPLIFVMTYYIFVILAQLEGWVEGIF